MRGEPAVAGVTTKVTGTPPEVKKWRKSNYAEPGRRVIHPGMIDDHGGRTDHPKFGKMKNESDHVEDVLRQPGAESEFALVKEGQKNASYHSVKREPLGKTYARGHVLPAECKEDGFSFGMPNADKPNLAKGLIYAPSEQSSQGMKEQYIKSHGSFEPGEQRRRGYDWPIEDVREHRFGVGVGSHIAFNGLALGAVGALRTEVEVDPVIASRVQNFKNLQDKLGRSRNLGHGPNAVEPGHFYGKASVRGAGEWDARNCLQGDYGAEAQGPDADLGTTHTPGFRNSAPESQRGDRAYGTPTVRSDIPKYAKRSIADHQNYGDDANAQALLYPSTLQQLGIDDNEFSKARSKAEILDIFQAIGTNFDARELSELYDDAADASTSGNVSIDHFRKVTLAASVRGARNR